MEAAATAAENIRRQRQKRLPLPPAEVTPLVGGARDRNRRGSGWWRFMKPSWEFVPSPSPPPPGPGDNRTLWRLWLVIACLSFPTLVFVSGVYRPPLMFVSVVSSAGGFMTEHRHQQYLKSGAPPPSNLGAAESPSPTAPAPAPAPGEELPYVLLPPAEAPATPPASGTGKSSVSDLRSASGQAASRRPPSSSDVRTHDDKLLGGLLSPGFGEASCRSRYRSYMYRKASPYTPSPHLLRRLRDYESLHRRCGPLTRSYKRSLLLLSSGGGGGRSSCKYVVWKPENGVGNRMLSLAATLLYALLSKRVLLVDGSIELAPLFCEPFPGSSWMLPLGFPLRNLPFGQKYERSYGNLLRTNRTGGGFIYAHLSSDYDDHDKRFYCEDDQLFLEGFPWMVLRSDQYFAPALFLNPAFRRELIRMFPEKEAVFHHLGRYLFHPSDDVWRLITSYYEDHLAAANETLGLQIRVFNPRAPLELIFHQILNCTRSQYLLPDVIDPRRRPAAGGSAPRKKAVLLASLHAGFYDKMEEAFSGHPTAGGEVVSFHQPSHEEKQRTGRAAHDGKALSEIYLLSLTDALVTSSWSTFGYVAQGLAGMTPWVLRGPVHVSAPNPACARDFSPEPCFHFPPDYDCAARKNVDTTKLLAWTRHCRDFRRGIKLVDDDVVMH